MCILANQGHIALIGLLHPIDEFRFNHIHVSTHGLGYSIVFSVPTTTVDLVGKEDILAPAVVNIHLEGTETAAKQFSWQEPIVQGISVGREGIRDIQVAVALDPDAVGGGTFSVALAQPVATGFGN